MASTIENANSETGFHRELSESSTKTSNRPPLPVPFGGSNGSIGNSSADIADAREGLRIDLTKQRKYLTTREVSFLEQLIAKGSDEEVSLARTRLKDHTLFFESSWQDDKVNLESESNIGSICKPDSESPLKRDASQGSRGSSERAQKHLEQRRNSGWHGKMWRAHENGIAPAADLRRKSAPQRRSSFSRVSDIRREAAIRSSGLVINMKSNLVVDGTAENPSENYGIFRGDCDANASTVESSKSTIAPIDIPKLLELSRLTSDGSRRSVSFKEGGHDECLIEARQGVVPMLPRRSQKIERHMSMEHLQSNSKLSHETSQIGSPSLIQSRWPLRSDSIPSIHHGNPIRSDSTSTLGASSLDGSAVRGSTSTGLRRVHPIRSDSITASSLGSFQSEGEEEDVAWSAPIPKKSDLSKGQLLRHPSQPEIRPVLLQRASNNDYLGEGIEVSEMDDSKAISFARDSLNSARNFKSMVSMGDESTRSLRTASSYDDAYNNDNIFRGMRTIRSEEDMRSYFLGAAKSLLNPSVNTLGENKKDCENEQMSWEMDSHASDEHFDAWKVLTDEYAVGYGANNSLPFLILGTSADDVDAHPHVLSPPLMESLQNFFPYSISEDNFWMKYSLLRDGASLHSLLQHSRGAKYTIIAIETVDGEVFGSFTADPWRKDWNYFGTGESFLWRMRQPRGTHCHSIIEQAQLESELDVYPWTGENNCVQLCTHEKLAVGGGTPINEKTEEGLVWGFGLALDRDLLHGTSSHCATFGSPPLSHIHDVSPFEIVNIEVWTTTPCFRLEDAEKLELGKLFLQTN